MIKSNYAKAYPNIEEGISFTENQTNRKQMVDQRVNEAIKALLWRLKRFLVVDKNILSQTPTSQLPQAEADKLNQEKAQLNQVVTSHNDKAAKFNSELITKNILASGPIFYRNSVKALPEVLSRFEDTTHFDPGMVYTLAIAANMEKDSFAFKDEIIDEESKKNMLKDFDDKKAMIRGALNKFVEEGGNVENVQFIAKLQKKLLTDSFKIVTKFNIDQEAITILEGIISDLDIAKTPYKDLLTLAVVSQDNQFPEVFLREMKERVQKRLKEFDPEMVKNIAQSLINLEVVDNELKNNSIPSNLMAGDDDVSKIIMNFTKPEIDLTNAQTSPEIKGLIYLIESADRMSSASSGIINR